MPEKSFEEKVLDDVRKSGFPTELEVTKRLIEKSWQVSNSCSYEDLDENKSREIDIVAHKMVRHSSSDCRIIPYLVVEVKMDTSKPWVIFTTDDEEWADYGWSILHSGHDYLVNGCAVMSGREMNTLLLSNGSTRTGKAFMEAFRGEGAPSRIYEALMSASKAAFFKRHQFGRDDELEELGDADTYLEFYIPVVVVKGDLFSLRLDEQGEEVLERSPWIPVRFQYSSPNYRGERPEWQFRPYVVAIQHLEAFLDVVETWHNSVALNMSNAVSRHRSRTKDQNG